MDLVYRKNFENCDIFIYSHIPFRPATGNHIYKVLTNSRAEASQFNTDLAIYRDYDGVNISGDNLMYNEYCGFYWIWKNYPIKKYVGMNHYRRYYNDCNNLPDIGKIFERKRIILNTPIQLRVPQGLKQSGTLMTNREWYAYWHNIEDFETLEAIITDKYPKYMEGFKKMADAKYLHGCNMFTMDKDTFEEYCNFVFPLIMDFRKERGFFTLQDCVDYVTNNQHKYVKEGLTYYDINKQSRIVGYLAERILGAFLWSGGSDSLIANSEEFKWSMARPDNYLASK